MLDSKTFCEAIKNRVLVTLQYKSDRVDRTFMPLAVYKSKEGKAFVIGKQVTNPAKPWDNDEFRNFEILEVKQAATTATVFALNAAFSSYGDHYKHGVICAVDR